MKKKHNLCCTVSERHKLRSLASEHGQIDGRVWRVHAKACENVRDGEERYYEK